MNKRIILKYQNTTLRIKIFLKHYTQLISIDLQGTTKHWLTFYF